MNLLRNFVDNMREKHADTLQRCDWCSWPIGDEPADCHPFDCSQRPMPMRDDSELREDFRRCLDKLEELMDGDRNNE